MRDSGKSEDLNEFVGRLSAPMSKYGYVDDSESSLSIDLAFISEEAATIADRIALMSSEALTRTQLRDAGMELSESIQHLLVHVDTALPRLNHFVELLND